MAVKIDSYASNLSKINAQISTAGETVKKLNIDKSLIDKAADKLGAEVLADPACRNYFKTMGQSLNVLTSRHWEIDFKADAARVEDPRRFAQMAFLDRDTSQSVIFQDRIPDITPELVGSWQEIGFLKPQEAEAMQKIFFSQIEETASQNTNAEEDEYVQFLQKFSDEQVEERVHAQQANLDTHRNGVVGLGLTRNTTSRVGAAPTLPPSSSAHPLGNIDSIARDRQTMNEYFAEGDSARGWMGFLLDSESKARDAVSNMIYNTQTVAQRKREIMAELAGIDTTTPEGAKRMTMAQYELRDVQDSERQLTEQMQQVLRWRTERIELVSKILEIQNQSLKQTSSKMN